MNSKKILSKIVFICVALSSNVAFGSGAMGTGEIDLIGGQLASSSTAVYFGLDAELTDRAACNDNSSGYDFAFDSSTAAGKALHSVILLARDTGKTIRVAGTGECNVRSNIEDIAYWILY